MTDIPTHIDPDGDFGSERIGPYKLLQPLGEGGMGSVYMAEQQEPVRRRVALKVIKAGMDTRQVIARFEAERQALALMDHQNIARVLDVGTTDDRRPFFVMELVQGIPITDYCDRNQLTLQERLQLLVPVCRAIQHAHQKGIIHRDIKPSNILVALHDGVPVPKVIDFGLAKALQQRLTERTMFTQFGQVVGTLEYMSPEQAEMNALDVDTRTDIYSLGVLLYELLTGSTPLQKQTIKEQAFDQILRIIREDDPPRPSTRLSESGNALPGISRQRRLDPRRLSQILRGDLDWIVMKALEKDRSRRYGTCADLADDIERFLRDEPIEARPPTATYRFSKLMRRHFGAVMVGMSFVAMLLATTGISIWLALRAASAETAAMEANRQLSEFNARLEDALVRAEELEKESRALAGAAQVEAMESSTAVEMFREVLLDQSRREAAFQVQLAPVPQMKTNKNPWEVMSTVFGGPRRLDGGVGDSVELVKSLSPALAATAMAADASLELSLVERTENQLLEFLTAEETPQVEPSMSRGDQRPAAVVPPPTTLEQDMRKGSDAVTLSVLTTLALASGRYEQAEDYARREIVIRETLKDDDWRIFLARSLLGEALLGQAKHNEARQELTSAWDGLSVRRTQIPEAVRSTRLAGVLRNLVTTSRQLGDATAVEMWQQELTRLQATP